MTSEREQGGPYAWYVVFVLIIAYTFSYVDRTILTLMVVPIRASLGISDVQISLLHGLAFAIFYTALGLPIGRLVDRRRRVTIITVGIMTWSVMTALCGLARSFGTMFLARIGVGVGEATLSPAAYSILSDYFPPAQLGRALSVFTCAMYIGSGLAMIAGGAMISIVPSLTLPVLGHLEAWQVVFMIVGLPGLLIGLLVMTLREPARRGVKLVAGAVQPSIREVVRYVAERRAAYLFLILGLSLSSLVWNGVSAWIPTYFIRHFGWSVGEIGTAYGIVLLTCGTGGILSGSILADRLRARGTTDSSVKVGCISAIVVIPAGIAGALASNPQVAIACFAAFVFAASLPYGNAAAALQEITPNQMRGQVAAIYILGINLAGIGLGPTIIALVSRALGGDDMLGPAIATVIAVCAPIALLVLTRAARPYRAAFDEFGAA